MKETAFLVRRSRTSLSLMFPEAEAADPVGAVGAVPPPAGGGTLAQQASEHYSRAMQAQRQGDWASYGAEIERLGDVLERLDSTQGQD